MKAKKYVKCNSTMISGLSFGAMYEVLKVFKNDSYNSGEGYLIRDDNNIFIGYDSSIFEQK